jgi:hypothetical protein
MTINDFHPYDDSEHSKAGMKQIKTFTSGHVIGTIFLPPDYEPHGKPEQCRTNIGCDPNLDFDSTPPSNHADHVERVVQLIHQWLIEIGDIT